jgi:zinc transport system ATP-binding protein
MLIRLEKISYGYGKKKVIEDVSLQMEAGDFIGMIGPNGGGKSTIIKILMGLIKPWTGSVVLGKSSKGSTTTIGYLPQYHDFDKRFPISVTEVILSGLVNQKSGGLRFSKADKLKVQTLLDQLGLSAKKNAPVGELSGGQMQRAFLGRAIIADPDLLILDEPVTYVDSKFEQELYEILEEINKQTAILLVSHDVGQIVSVVKTIACVNQSLHYHPSNKISAEVLASYNCPIELITHGKVPHRVLHNHKHHD